MSLGLSVLICLCSVGILAGRVYEILKLTDPLTGLLITNGIALNPLLLGIFLIITVCCGVLVFGGEKNDKPFFSKSSGIIAALAGVAFVIFGIMQITQSRMAILTVAGGIGWLLLGLTGLGRKPKDAVIMALMTLFSVGLCLEVIIFDVYSVHYTEFMHRVLASAGIMLLIIAVFRNVYAPSKLSRMFLYISGFICFAFGGMLSIAELICAVTAGQAKADFIVENAAFILIGIYALDNALSVLPKDKKDADDEEENKADFHVCEEQPAGDYPFAEGEPAIVKTEDKTVFANERKVFRGDKVTSSKTEKIVYKKPK